MGAGHDHGPISHEPVAPPRLRRILEGIVGAVVVLTLVGVFVLRPSDDLPPLGEEFGFTEERFDATVTDVDITNCANTDPQAQILCEEIAFDLSSADAPVSSATFQQAIEPLNPDFEVGDEIVVGYRSDIPEFIQFRFADYQRDRPLLLLAVLFAVAVVALGRIQGIRALLGLAVTGAVVLAFVLPAMLDGKNPLAVALVGSALVAVAALYLTHGFNERTTVALLGTLASLTLTGVLALVFIGFTEITGLASEDAVLLRAAGADVDLRGLVLAGIVIGSLGVLDDVTVTQVSAVWQLHLADPAASFGRLYSSAIAIGRDHIASTVNTLVLAYAGAALPLLLIFSQSDRPVSEWLTSELVGTEVVRTLVGSIGLVASVPITTVLAAGVVIAGRQPDPGEPATAGPVVAPTDPAVVAEAADPGTADPAADEDAGPPGWDDFTPQDRTDRL